MISLDSFIDVVCRSVAGPLPAHVVHQARRCLLDYLGATLAGARMMADRHEALLAFLGDTSATVPIIGSEHTASLATAAFVNGISSHAAELDDGVISGIIHPGAPIFSALVPAAIVTPDVTGDTFVRAIVAGYEAAVRLANAIQPSHKLRGWHATATCGSLGAVFAIQIMRGVDSETLKRALSAAAVSVAGSLKVLEDASELKPFNTGQAARSAITAVALAEAGFAAPDDAFAGRAGFFEMMADVVNQRHLVSHSADGFAIEDVYFKPYACCRYCHGPAEAAIRLWRDVRPDPAMIDSVRVTTYQLAIPHHDHTRVTSSYSAKMSIPFGTAVALVHGSAGIDRYSTEGICDAAVLAVCDRIVVEADPGFTDVFPAESPARVTVVMRDGSSHAAEVRVPKGSPATPLSDEELAAKFRTLAGFGGMELDWIDRALSSTVRLPASFADLLRLFSSAVSPSR